MEWRVPPVSLGSILAVIVLVLAIVFFAVRPDDPDTERAVVYGLIGLLAVARLT